MSRKKVQKTKPKSLTNKRSQTQDVPVKDAIEILKTEIIEEVLKLASGQARSVYDLLQKGKELKELQSGAWDDLEKTKKPSHPEIETVAT